MSNLYQKEIDENLKLVLEGKALKLPLRELRCMCDFKRLVYREINRGN